MNKRNQRAHDNAISIDDKTAIELLMHLRRVVSRRYQEKFGHDLNWERGWAWEALAFIDNELNKPRRTNL